MQEDVIATYRSNSHDKAEAFVISIYDSANNRKSLNLFTSKATFEQGAVTISMIRREAGIYV